VEVDLATVITRTLQPTTLSVWRPDRGAAIDHASRHVRR
jgi:hypothetical protein